MDKEKLRQKISKNKKENWQSRILRKVSFFIVRGLLQTKITPNQVSLLSYVPLILIGVFMATGRHVYLIWTVPLFILAFVLDLVDGDLSRARDASSQYGEWLDTLGSLFSDFVFLFGAIIGLYLQALRGEANILWTISLTEHHVLILGALALFSLILVKILGGGFSILIQQNSKQQKKQKDHYQKILKNKWTFRLATFISHDGIYNIMLLANVFNQRRNRSTPLL